MDMALIDGLGMDMAIVREHKVVVIAPVLGIVSCGDPRSMRYLGFHVVDSLWDEFV